MSTLKDTLGYFAWKRSTDHPSLVIQRFLDDQGRRCTQFVAECNSAGRDTDADAQFIADAFNRRGEGGPQQPDNSGRCDGPRELR